MLRVRNKLWLISDTHFGHHNIIKFSQRPRSHELIMVSNWIDRVGEKDQILHLGDVVVKKRGAPLRWLKVVGRLPGEKYLILGNHDLTDHKPYEAAGFTIIEPFIHEGIAFTHRPISNQFNDFGDQEWHTNIHGHTHTNEFMPEHDGNIFADKKYINICVEHTGLAPVQLGNVYPLETKRTS